MPTIEDKFYAGVNVIQKLPKNGSFKPSNELLLRFYSYYKQATIGPCNTSKPSFWDVVGKAKWDAWQSLGNMSKLEAMNKYVDEIKQIIETMPQTAEVTNFLTQLGPFFELVDTKTGEKVLNGQINHYKMADSSGIQATTEESFLNEKDFNQPIISKAILGKSSDSDSDSEHFEDSSDNPLVTLSSYASMETEPQVSRKPNASSNQEAKNQSCSNTPAPMETHISEQLRAALNSMQEELVTLDRRLSLVEKLTVQQRNNQIDREQRNWWPFRNIEPRTVMLILIWPIFVSWFIRYLARKRKR